MVRIIALEKHIRTRGAGGGGDFNATKSSEERRGKSKHNRNSEIEEFSSFIDLMELVDLPIVWNKYTWISSDGYASSMIERLLLFEGLINN